LPWPRWGCRPRGQKASRALRGASLGGMPPPGIIFALGCRPAVFVRLQTADYIRLASLMQEAQGAVAPCDGTRIMGFAIGEEHDALALLFENRGGRIFSAMLWPHNGLLLCARNKGGDLSRIYTAPDRFLLILGEIGRPVAKHFGA